MVNVISEVLILEDVVEFKRATRRMHEPYKLEVFNCIFQCLLLLKLLGHFILN